MDELNRRMQEELAGIARTLASLDTRTTFEAAKAIRLQVRFALLCSRLDIVLPLAQPAPSPESTMVQ